MKRPEPETEPETELKSVQLFSSARMSSLNRANLSLCGLQQVDSVLGGILHLGSRDVCGDRCRGALIFGFNHYLLQVVD
jgi:hypothetical protein